ncbi:septum formation initiator family protein [Cellulomonas sp. NTE-D12]|uniref:FtsB family cell division protein n=1 Tax=Cellulomonas sp. NTE-D12 TaxID=2962632 RepID=UPI0030816363
MPSARRPAAPGARSAGTPRVAERAASGVTPRTTPPRTGAPPRTTAPRTSPPRASRRPAAARASTRPSSITPPRGTPRAEVVQQRLPRMLTVRAMVLGLVLLLAFVLVYPTLHSYLEQQTQLAQLRAQVAAAQQHNSDLQADLKRWDDPAYVKAQARERLNFVMPGETAFRVVDPQTVPDTAPNAPKTGASDGSGAVGSTQPWYLDVWQSVRAAGAAAAPTTKATSGATSAPTGSPTAAPTGAAKP